MIPPATRDTPAGAREAQIAQAIAHTGANTYASSNPDTINARQPGH